MEKFTDDDAGYLRWINDHPDGFVVNIERGERPGYAALHRATCTSISRDREDGAYTERGYKKVVSESLEELRSYARSIGRADGSSSKQCGHCQPN
ncbi:MAG: hypothetical protein R3E14_09345 [Erythrobacter sp.]